MDADGCAVGGAFPVSRADWVAAINVRTSCRPRVFPQRYGAVRKLLCTCVLALTAGGVAADDAIVAVAANFARVMGSLEVSFESATAHRLTVVVGSTGKLYAQIVNGAPFDVFLAADRRRPALLEKHGFAVSNSRFTYAFGQLVLWSADETLVRGPETLTQGEFRRLAMANPDLAPYGSAALEVLQKLGVDDTLRKRIVMGENVGQAHAMVATGNAELGFVARSFLDGGGSRWDVPQDLYEPLRQDAVLLTRGAASEAARAFMAFLVSETARDLIVEAGYGVE